MFATYCSGVVGASPKWSIVVTNWPFWKRSCRGYEKGRDPVGPRSSPWVDGSLWAGDLIHVLIVVAKALEGAGIYNDRPHELGIRNL